MIYGVVVAGMLGLILAIMYILRSLAGDNRLSQEPIDIQAVLGFEIGGDYSSVALAEYAQKKLTPDKLELFNHWSRSQPNKYLSWSFWIFAWRKKDEHRRASELVVYRGELERWTRVLGRLWLRTERMLFNWRPVLGIGFCWYRLEGAFVVECWLGFAAVTAGYRTS